MRQGGHLSPGDSIPSVRKMAQTLDITPSTVAKAYQELERQKVIETIRAKGTFIATMPSMDFGKENKQMLEIKNLQKGYNNQSFIYGIYKPAQGTFRQQSEKERKRIV